MYYLWNNENKVFPLSIFLSMATKKMLPRLGWDENHKMLELENILEDAWFNPTSHFRDEEAEAQHGEMTAGLYSRTRQKLVQCFFH